MRRVSLVVAAVGGLASITLPPSVALAQRGGQPTTLALRTPDAEYAEPFSAISGVRELRDGRVIVADRTEKSIQLVDLARGTATRIGIEGGGPNEYRLPGAVFALPGDSTAIFDFGNMRYLLVAPDGSVAGTFTTMDPSDADVRVMLPARGVDGAGNLYLFDRGLGGRDGDGSVREPADSGTVLRFDRRTRTLTPVARVAVPKAQVRSEGSAGNQRVMVRLGTPFAAQDDWSAGLDGRIAVVRHDPYRVEWVAPNGQRVTGPAVPYERMRVTDADKAQYRERSRNASVQGIGVRIERGGGGTTAQAAPAPATTMRVPEPTDWPEFKPPFLGNAATIAPDGRLWVLRTNPAGDFVPRYDVFDSFGARTGTVALPANTRLIGFGRDAAYVVRTDEDDLQYLQKYALWK